MDGRALVMYLGLDRNGVALEVAAVEVQDQRVLRVVHHVLPAERLLQQALPGLVGAEVTARLASEGFSWANASRQAADAYRHVIGAA